ncbi:MAG TPA: GxxExxY protein [Acetobacteraceae bacterium]|nr:GxxExxY protein [Acetobacteraceae bacterium]
MDADKGDCYGLSEAIVGAAFAVSNGLGAGFAENVQENCLALGLRDAGLEVRQQFDIAVHYKGRVVGSFAADLLVEDSILVELNVARALERVHAAQCVNYLQATRLRLCLLLNFGNPRVEVRRLVNGL